MKNLGKGILLLVGLLVAAGAILFIVYQVGMKPNHKKEREIQEEAKEYVKETFSQKIDVYGSVYDNMGNFEFDYAAKARDPKTGTDFLVYHDDATGEMVDSYVGNKWQDDAEKDIKPYVKEKLGEKADVNVFYNEEVGKRLGISPSDIPSYKTSGEKSTIRITLSRHREKDDDATFNELVTYIHNTVGVEKGTVIVGYVADNGEILDDNEWVKEFK